MRTNHAPAPSTNPAAALKLFDQSVRTATSDYFEATDGLRCQLLGFHVGSHAQQEMLAGVQRAVWGEGGIDEAACRLMESAQHLLDAMSAAGLFALNDEIEGRA